MLVYYIACYSQITVFSAVYFALLFTNHRLQCCLFCPVIHKSLFYVLSIFPCYSQFTFFCAVYFALSFTHHCLLCCKLYPVDVVPSTAPVLVLCFTETTRRTVPGSHHSYKMLTTRKQLCSSVGRMAWPATPWLPLTWPTRPIVIVWLNCCHGICQY